MKKRLHEIHPSKQPDRSPGDSLSDKQTSAIVAAANSDASLRIVSDVVKVVLHTGLLSSQLSTLRISDVDVENLRYVSILICLPRDSASSRCRP